ncbi:hypothetical protein [Rhodococcus sp. B7740]|uniref:hypothetical protein n=1 Tax=Rhodococcus sp. B7740 TaxID=1564114 RepID=UPI00118497FA|nr:hypothetical protein [Rhodococcus sp. B7740]
MLGRAAGTALDSVVVERSRALVTYAANAVHIALSLAPHRPLGRALSPGGSIDLLVAEGGVLDRIGGSADAIDVLLGPDGVLERLGATGGALEQISELNAAVAALVPHLAELAPSMATIAESSAHLSAAVARVPGLRVKTTRSRVLRGPT